MNKIDVKNILMNLRNINNEYVVNYLLGELGMMSEEELQQRLENNGILDADSLKSQLSSKIEDKLKDDIASGRHTAYANAIQNNRESRTFSELKSAYEKLRAVLENENLIVYIAGGSVPYFLLNQDSNRLHDDIDSICTLENIGKIREAIKNAGLYNPAWDSKTFVKNEQDYGFEIMIDNVPIGIYPFEYKEGILTQYTYDPYERRCKIQNMELADISDYIASYQSVDGRKFDTMSLEYIKKSKDRTIGRPKDVADSEKIGEYGFRPEVYERINLPRLVKNCKADEFEGR